MSELCCIGTGAPKARPALLGPLAQALELAAVGVGERGGAGQTEGDEVLVEEVLVGAISIGVEVDVGEGSAVGVLGVSYARDLEPNKLLREGLLRVGAASLPKQPMGCSGATVSGVSTPIRRTGWTWP